MRKVILLVFGSMAFGFGMNILFSSSAFALCVNEEKANLRQGPGTQWRKTWEVIRYTPLKKLAKKGGWYRVEDIEGTIHWVKEDLVTEKFSCAAVKEEFTYLRTGPGTNYKKTKAERADRYVAFRILQTKGNWVKVEDIEGDSAWIARENLWIQ